MKKLLITMGDSSTFGHGSYVPELEEKFKKNEITNNELFSGSISSFFDNSWPNQVAKYFNFDLINIARPGGSNSGQAKRLIGPIIKDIDVFDDFFINYAKERKDQINPKLIYNQINEINFNEYDKVTLIWILSYPQRFSFFKKGKVKDIIPTVAGYDDEREFGKWYIKYIEDELDYVLETVFYLNVVEMFCKVNNINFLYGSIANNHTKYFPYFYRKNSCINILENGNIIHFPDKFKEFKNTHSFCGHPNIKGYKILADEIIRVIETHFSHSI